jgi:hypothetical protein
VNDLRSRVNIKERVPAGKTPGRADGVLRHFSADFSEKSGIVGLTPPFCGRPRLILAVGTQAMRISHFCSIKPGVAGQKQPVFDVYAVIFSWLSRSDSIQVLINRMNPVF